MVLSAGADQLRASLRRARFLLTSCAGQPGRWVQRSCAFTSCLAASALMGVALLKPPHFLTNEGLSPRSRDQSIRAVKEPRHQDGVGVATASSEAGDVAIRQHVVDSADRAGWCIKSTCCRAEVSPKPRIIESRGARVNAVRCPMGRRPVTGEDS